MTWTPVTEAMPASGKTVLAFYLNSHKLPRRIRAQWIAKHSIECTTDSDLDLDYDERADEYYLPEGWYERVNNWDDYARLLVYEGEVSHWMDMPEGPKP